MKIYIHGLYYQDYEDRGSLNIVTDKEMNEEEFMEFYNKEYAGKKYDEVDGVFLDMYIDKDEDGNEIMPTFCVDDENINADIGYKYKVKGDKYSEEYKFFKTNLIVKGIKNGKK